MEAVLAQMSTYAVFGMTMDCAIKIARKNIDKSVPESKWAETVAKEANEIMESRQCVMLSDKFDAPEFARDFKRLAMKSESRDLHIKAYCKTGERSEKTGRSLMHWIAA